MLRNISHTILTRSLVILLTFAVVWMNTNQTGAEGQADVALISLGILLIVGLNNFMGGGAIVFLTPRISPADLFFPCLTWSLVTTLFFYLLFAFLPIVPERYEVHVLALGLLQSMFTFYQQVILGRNKVFKFNLLIIAQWLITAGVLACLYFFAEIIDPISYVYSLYAAFGATLILGFILTFKEWKKITLKNNRVVIRQIWRYGFYSQSGNIFQLLAYRLSYIILEQTGYHAGVGIFSVGMQINEAAVTPVKSMATVQYAHISNSEDHSDNIRVTVSLIKLGLLITLLTAGVIALLPETFYLFIFGPEMAGIKSVLNWLCLGMGGLAISSIVAHFFSGTGQHRHNTVGSLVTLVSLAILGVLFIPDQGLIGAAWISATAYLLQALYLFLVFAIDEKPNRKDFLGFRKDLTVLRAISSK